MTLLSPLLELPRATVYTAAAPLALLCYAIGLVVYRLLLSPLARIPGSRIAAATGWYEFYFDVWLDGQYLFEIERMHRKYGPIIRINPVEISIHDPDFYNEVYVTESKRRTSHYDQFCQGIDFDGAFLLTADHDLHKKRRKPFEPFFSKRGIASLQPMLGEVALQLESRLEGLRGGGQVVTLDHVFSACTGDIIQRICLDDGDGDGGRGGRFLGETDFGAEWYNVVNSLLHNLHLFIGLPWLVRIVKLIPEPIMLWAFPRGRVFKIFTDNARRNIRKAMSDTSSSSKNHPNNINTNTNTSLFHAIISSGMPPSELSEDRLTSEAQVMLGGGTVTPARTIGFATYYVLSRPEIRRRLAEELKEVMAGWPDEVPAWSRLEQLPFLQSVIKEALRLSYGIMHRLPRVFPDEPLQYKQYTIPAGVPVGMSAYLMHSDPSVYPSPDQFIPERWLGDVDPAMHRSFVPFSRGSRNCLGMNLAMAEMSLILAVLFRPGGVQMRLFESDESDVRNAHDFMLPLPKLSSKGLRVLIV